MAVAGFVGLLIIHFTGDETEAKEVTEIIMAGAVVIGYIIGEGLADSATFYIESSDKSDEVEDEDLKPTFKIFSTKVDGMSDDGAFSYGFEAVKEEEDDGDDS